MAHSPLNNASGASGPTPSLTAVEGLVNSNHTSQFFLGRQQPAWMMAQFVPPASPRSLRPPANISPTVSTAPTPARLPTTHSSLIPPPTVTLQSPLPTVRTTEHDETIHVQAMEPQRQPQVEDEHAAPMSDDQRVHHSALDERLMDETSASTSIPTPPVTADSSHRPPSPSLQASQVVEPRQISNIRPSTRHPLSPSLSPETMVPRKRPRVLSRSEIHGSPVTNPPALRRMDEVPQGSANPQLQTPQITTTSTTAHHVPQLYELVGQLQTANIYGPLEAQRAALLRDACNQNDLFYIYLHKLACFDALASLASAEGTFDHQQLKGLRWIKTILYLSDIRSQEALKAFSAFPLPTPQGRTNNEFAAYLDPIKVFLSIFSANWSSLRNECLKRRFPPNARELDTRLFARSLILRKILFAAINQELLKDTTRPVEAGEHTMVYFLSDQSKYMSHPSFWQPRPASSTATLDPHAKAELTRFGNGYFKVLTSLEVGRVARQPSGSANSTGGNNIAAAPQNIWTIPFVSSQIMPDPRNHPRGNTESRTSAPQPFAAIPHQFQLHPGHIGRIPQAIQTTSFAGAQPIYQPPIPTSGLRPLGIPAHLETYHGAARAPNYNFAQQSPGSMGLPPRYEAISPSLPVEGPTPIRPTSTTPLYLPSNPPFDFSNPPLQFPQRLVSLIPPATPVLNTSVNPNTDRIALHQAHSRSPVPQKRDKNGNSNPNLRLYQYADGFVLEPQHLNPARLLFSWEFDISPEDMKLLAKDVPINPARVDLMPQRIFKPDSLLYRLRCVRLNEQVVPGSSEWSAAYTAWPGTIFISLNDLPLEIRRKSHHGRDLAIDLTSLVQTGRNKLLLSIHRSPAEKEFGFSLAIERVKVIDHATALLMPSRLEPSESLASIARSLKCDSVDNDDIRMVDSHLSIDLLDPFMSTIFKQPVRGKNCLHRECFDLDAFLQSRTSRAKGGPTNPDEWRCPICKRDARPVSLVIDGFLAEVKNTLEEQGLLQTIRAILVKSDGTWEPKRELVSDDSKPNRKPAPSPAEAGAARKESLPPVGVQERGDTETTEIPQVIELDD